MFLAFGKGNFQFFTIFEWRSWNQFNQKPFQPKFGYRNLLRKWFWSFLELKNQCFSFLQISDWRSSILWKSETKCSKLFKSKFDHSKLLRKWLAFEATLSSKTNVVSVWKGNFSVFCNTAKTYIKPTFLGAF